jgi:hypothetical protein
MPYRVVPRRTVDVVYRGPVEVQGMGKIVTEHVMMLFIGDA